MPNARRTVVPVHTGHAFFGKRLSRKAISAVVMARSSTDLARGICQPRALMQWSPGTALRCRREFLDPNPFLPAWIRTDGQSARKVLQLLQNIMVLIYNSRRDSMPTEKLIVAK